MSVTLYDTAIAKKIQTWTKDPNLTILAPDETSRVFDIRADRQNDKPLQLPLIAISRGRDITIQRQGKHHQTFSGKVFNSDGNSSDHLNAIPITLNYQLDIYTRYQEENDEYVRNFVFNIVNYPRMEFVIPYNKSNLSYISFMRVGETITDNSDIPERLVAGQFVRTTMSIELNDAYLFSYNHKHLPQIVAIDINATTFVYDDSGNVQPGEVEDIDYIELPVRKRTRKTKGDQ